jgi:hypothetical protein
VDSAGIPLVIEFAAGTTLFRERDRASDFPILRNGPAGTFVVFPDGLRVSLPTDQIVQADEANGRARIGFGGMHFSGLEGGQLMFLRVRELHPERQLSPERSHVMRLDPSWVLSIRVDGHVVWPRGSSAASV